MTSGGLRVAGLLAGTTIALSPLIAAIQPATAGSAGEAALVVTMTSLRPTVPQPGDTLVIRGRVTNASDADITDRWIFAGNLPLPREVHVGGHTPVAGGRHRGRDGIAARYREAIRRLL